MSDVALEVIRALILTIIVGYLWYVGNKAAINKEPGWAWLVLGFALILFGSYIDITDNFASLNRFVWMGDTDEQAFLEKVIGYTFGFSFLAFGLWQWLPNVIKVKTQRIELLELNQQLQHTISELEKANQETLLHMAERIKTEKARQHLASQLQQNQRLDALSQLAGSMAHDFNNLLTGVLGYVDMSKIALQDQSPHTSLYINEALSATEKARDFVQQVLLFSSKNVAQLEPTPVSALVTQALHLIESIKEDDIQLVYQCQIPEDTLINADKVQFNQLLINLLRNGLDAMSHLDQGDKRLMLTVDRVTLAEDHHYADNTLRAGPCISIMVEDTGTGIESEVLSHIFEPYFSTQDKSRGTGLGLAVVHGIVKSHGAVLHVSTQLNQGTRFVCLLAPCDLEHTPDSECSTDEPSTVDNSSSSSSSSSSSTVKTISSEKKSHPEHILFVDDEPGIISLMEKVFSSLGYQACTYLNPLDALKAFEEQPDAFQLVILDQQMPHLLGTELAEKIHSIRPELPIILHTGQLLDKKTLKLDHIGICELVPKPIKIGAFDQLLNQVLGKASVF